MVTLIFCLLCLKYIIAAEINLAILQDVGIENSESIIESVKEKVHEVYPETIINHEIILRKAESQEEKLDTFSRTVKSGGIPWNLILDFAKKVPLNNNLMGQINVPVISTNYGGSNENLLTCSSSSNIIQINPPEEVIGDVVRDIVLQLNRSNAMVLYDDTFGMKNKYQSLLRNIPTRHIFLHLDMNPDKMPFQMENLKEIDISNFFILASEENLRNILKKVEEHSMFDKNIAWYAISKDVLKQDLPCDKCKLLAANPMITYTAFLEQIQEITISPHSILDVSFMYDVLFLSLMSFIKSTLPENGSVRAKVPTGEDLLYHMEQMNYGGVLGKYVFNKNCNNYAEIKLELKKIKKETGLPQLTSVVGSWTYGKDNKHMFLPDANMKEFLPITMYRIATYVKPPFVYKTIQNDGTVKFEGICIDLMNKLKTNLNFEYDLYEVPSDEAKSSDTTGIVGEVVNRNADIALAPVFITSEMERVVDFTIPYYDLVGMKILMMKPIIETSMFRFLTVMEANVWFSILGAYVFTSILLWFIDRLSPFSYQNNKDKFINDSEKREFTLTECFWFCVTSLTPQGGGEAPKNVSGRMLAATWWLFSFIVIASYTANLAAFLTVSRLDNPIDSLDGLANQYKVQYATVNGSAAMHYFKRMAFIENEFFEKWKEMTMGDDISEEDRTQFSVWEYPVSDRYTKIWQAIRETGMPETIEEGIERIRNTSGDFALIADMTEVRYAAMINCDLVEVGEEFSRRALGLVVRKGSLLKEQLSLAILHLQNKRELENLKETWWTNNEYKAECDEGDANTDGISIKNIGGVFIVILVGMVIAWVVLGFEYWWHRVYKKDQVQNIERKIIKEISTMPQNIKNDKELAKYSNSIADKKQIYKRYVFTTN